MSKAKGSRKPPSAEQVTERILAECHEIYTDEENGLLGIAKSLGKFNFQKPLIIFRSWAHGTEEENQCHAYW